MKMLALVHISSRYHVGAVLEEAREVFEPTRRPARLRPGRDPVPRAGRAAAWSRTERGRATEPTAREPQLASAGLTEPQPALAVA